MRVVVNGREIDVPENLTVAGLVAHLGLVSGPVAVELNQEIVPRATHAHRAVAEGDSVEIVHFVGGG